MRHCILTTSLHPTNSAQVDKIEIIISNSMGVKNMPNTRFIHKRPYTPLICGHTSTTIYLLRSIYFHDHIPIQIYIWLHLYSDICLHTTMPIWLCVFTHICGHKHIHVFILLRRYIYMFTFLHAHVSMQVYRLLRRYTPQACIHTSTPIYLYMSAYHYVYIYIYIYTYINLLLRY